MSDQGTAWDLFLRKQQDILNAYQKGVADICEDQKTVTRLLTIAGKGENILEGGNILPPFTYGYKANIQTQVGVFNPLTVVPVDLKNSKKIRLIWTNGQMGGSFNGTFYPPQFFMALSQSAQSIDPSNFYAPGSVVGMYDYFVDNFGNTTGSWYYGLDVTVAVSGNRFIHLCGWGDNFSVIKDIFSYTSSVSNAVPVSYQLIG